MRRISCRVRGLGRAGSAALKKKVGFVWEARNPVRKRMG